MSYINQQDILNYLKSIKPNFSKMGIQKLGLFGSFAKNQTHFGSDIDISVKFDDNFIKSCDVWEYFNILNLIKSDIAGHFKIKVDVFDLDSSTDIRDKIEKESLYV